MDPLRWSGSEIRLDKVEMKLQIDKAFFGTVLSKKKIDEGHKNTIYETIMEQIKNKHQKTNQWYNLTNVSSFYL